MTLSVFQDRWAQAVLAEPVPEEPESTCRDCAMLGEEGGGFTFRPDTKCCTYLPSLSNFLVGAILADPSTDDTTLRGRRSVEERIARGDEATPLGLDVRADYRSRFDGDRFENFGRRPELRCPHYLADTGACGIWRHRNGVCATWYCKHVRGATGRSFWASLQALLSAVETDLAFWCLGELGLDPDSLRGLLLPGARVEAREAWGSWRGREGEFYRRTTALVAPLGWDEVLARTGPRVHLLVGVVRSARARLATREVPPVLVPGRFQVAASSEGACRVIAYSPYDPVEIPLPLLESLAAFDGRPTGEVVAELAGRIELDAETLSTLVDFGILEAP